VPCSGDLVALLDIGEDGHLGVQFIVKFATVLCIDGRVIILLTVSLRIFPEPSPTVGESRERVPSEVQ
jgi:hypothetical protein